MSHVLIIGAKSQIAKELAKIYATNGYNLYLAARECETLLYFSNDVRIRTQVEVQLNELDITNFDTHSDFYNKLNPAPEIVIVVSGFMSDQKICENDWSNTLNTIEVNYTGVTSLLNIIANDMEKKKKGSIVAISSVAGDRGRKANYIYGSSKAALSAYLSGLRNRLYLSNVNVLTVKPGFIATNMTVSLKLPKLLTAKPQQVAFHIFNSQQKKKDILYTKSIWALIMYIIKFIPEPIFKRMNL
jgi:decaprenylphospho-beta-D-erythro-pentofuranosid-2-ulose 2-reductase